MARNKPHGPNGKSREKAITKFKSRHPEGRKKFAAEKALAVLSKKRKHHQGRGKVGHVPRPRKILSSK